MKYIKESTPLIHKMVLMLIGACLLLGCRQKKYYNTQLQGRKMLINFYKPDSFQFVKKDTLKFNYINIFSFKYQNVNDTNITIMVQFDGYQHSKFPADFKPCDLKCELKNRMFNLSGSIDTESQYGYLTKFNRQPYARVHYNLYRYKYVCDHIFTLYNDSYVSVIITSFNYDLNDTMKYTALRDTLFKSIVLVR